MGPVVWTHLDKPYGALTSLMFLALIIKVCVFLRG